VWSPSSRTPSSATCTMASEPIAAHPLHRSVVGRCEEVHGRFPRARARGTRLGPPTRRPRNRGPGVPTPPSSVGHDLSPALPTRLRGGTDRRVSGEGWQAAQLAGTINLGRSGGRDLRSADGDVGLPT
jgi:hypothetical protein